jgi:hypothetical protein
VKDWEIFRLLGDNLVWAYFENCIKFGKNGFGYSLGDLFANSSGHPAHNLWSVPGLAAGLWLAPTTTSAPATASASTAPATARNPTSVPTVKVSIPYMYY